MSMLSHFSTCCHSILVLDHMVWVGFKCQKMTKSARLMVPCLRVAEESYQLHVRTCKQEMKNDVLFAEISANGKD